MKVIIETGPVGDHPPEDLDFPDGSSVLVGQSGDLYVNDHLGNQVYCMQDEDWTEVRIVKGEDL